MTYVGVSDLKRSREMWRLLDEEKELILTRDGKPGAMIVQLKPNAVESTINAVRDARFGELLDKIWARAKKIGPLTEEEIEEEIQATRRARKY
ncbi:MAG: hypothetical protein LBK60_09630 [Verrucomicrobiales bacterium]|jgi:hypothetical protein|nr:hypothetical protein [Verrucomicrobiales bacterium]